MKELKELLLDVTNLISTTKVALNRNERCSHSDVDAGDDENKSLKERLTVLKEVREKLENLL